MNDNRRFPYPGAITSHLLGQALEALAEPKGPRTVEHQMFLIFLSVVWSERKEDSQESCKAKTARSVS